MEVHEPKWLVETLIDAASSDKAVSVDIRTPEGRVRLRVEQKAHKRVVTNTFRVNGQPISKAKAKSMLATHARLCKEANENGDR